MKIDIRALLESQLKEEEKRKKEYSSMICGMPDGSLCASKHGDTTYYSHCSAGHRNYIGNETSPLVRKLQLKKFAEAMAKTAGKNERLIAKFLNAYQPSDPAHIFRQLPKAYQGAYIFSEFCDKTVRASSWEKVPYEKSSYRPEGLIHSTERGDFVRSKSEVLIANMLYSRNIPYRYEEVLHLGHTTIVPDFTVFIENENRVKLLEHCGLMSNGDYRLRLAEKISIYMDYGYYVGDNLFLTYDEPDGSIDTRRIARIMDAFFV